MGWSKPVVINGPVNATVAGNVNATIQNASVPVSGNVNATIQNASIPVTGNVNANVTGTADVNVTNATVNVGGSVAGNGGYILPGNEVPIFQAGTLNGATNAGGVGANSAFYAVAGVDVSAFQSYDISMLLECPNQNLAGPLTCMVRLTWFNDNTSGIPVYVEEWYPWVVSALPSDSSKSLVTGSGAMHGRYMHVSIYNGGGQLITVQFLEVYGSARARTMSTWNQPVATSSQFQFGGPLPLSANSGDGYDCNLYDVTTAALQPNFQYVLPLNLYAGNVNYYFHTTQSLTADPVILDVGSNYKAFTGGNLPFNVASQGSLLILQNNSNGQNGALLLPQAACALMLYTGAVAPTVQFKVTATNQ